MPALLVGLGTIGTGHVRSLSVSGQNYTKGRRYMPMYTQMHNYMYIIILPHVSCRADTTDVLETVQLVQ